MTYRPPGRSNRSGRAQADNDVFEGLPVKQWGQQIAHVSLAPPKSENANGEDDKWGEPPMPRDYQLLQPWTQQLLRLARSGKVGTKRKPDPDSMDDDKAEDEIAEEAKTNLEDRGYVAKKWKPVPEALLEPEHKHFEFLAKRRKGLPSLYGPEIQNGAPVLMRKTKVQRAGTDGEIAIYEVLVPEGQTVEGEVTETMELPADIKPVAAAPGTVIEGVGIANDDGLLVAEHLKPANIAPRRNRPPPKKKGGPGRGKKRVTFTNPDGSTYTTIVPNATKIVPQPGQIVRHVAKGEEANPDVSATQAAAHVPTDPGEGGADGEDGEEGEGSDEDGSGDEDDDREEGELSEEDAPTAGVTPVPPEKTGEAGTAANNEGAVKAEDTVTEDAQQPPASEASPRTKSKDRDASSSPELPLAKSSHSRHNSLATAPTITVEHEIADLAMEAREGAESGDATNVAANTDMEKFEDGEEDLLGNLEKSLGGDGAGGDGGEGD